VAEVALRDHRVRVRDRGLAQARVLAQQRQVVLRAYLVVQAEDRVGDRVEVRRGRQRIGVLAGRERGAGLDGLALVVLAVLAMLALGLGRPALVAERDPRDDLVRLLLGVRGGGGDQQAGADRGNGEELVSGGQPDRRVVVAAPRRPDVPMALVLR
jgi:hypothetical protein